MDDTDPNARRRYFELLRAQPPHERLAQAERLSRTVRRLALVGLRQRFPDADDRELKKRLAVRLYGRAIASKLFTELPDNAT